MREHKKCVRTSGTRVQEGIVSDTQGIEEDVLDNLSVEKLTATKQLEECLDNKLKVDRRLAGMCSRLQFAV